MQFCLIHPSQKLLRRIVFRANDYVDTDFLIRSAGFCKMSNHTIMSVITASRGCYAFAYRTCYRGRYQAAITRRVARRVAALRRSQRAATSTGSHTTTTSVQPTHHHSITLKILLVTYTTRHDNNYLTRSKTDDGRPQKN